MKKGIYIVFALLACSGAQAQVFVKSSAQQMVEDAVGGGLYVLRQEYQLKDEAKGKLYTWNNQPEFGHSISFCVVADNGYVISEQALKPWEYDSKYGQFRDAYLPVMTKSYVRSASSGSDPVEIGPIVPAEQTALENGWSFASDSAFSARGFLVDASAGEKDGWLIWLLSNNAETPENGELSLLSYRHELTIDSSTPNEIPACNTDQYVFGGVYVVPAYPEIGMVEYKLVGLIVNSGDKWNLLRLSPSGEETADSSNAAGPETGKLTESE